MQKGQEETFFNDEKELRLWAKSFTKKLKRRTSRNDLDRLILSVERMKFDRPDFAGWTEFMFVKRQGLFSIHLFINGEQLRQTFLPATLLQQKLLYDHGYLVGKIIYRSELREETGEWICDDLLEKNIISVGGEAIVLKETYRGCEFAVRVQSFDSALFTKETKNDPDSFHTYRNESIHKGVFTCTNIGDYTGKYHNVFSASRYKYANNDERQSFGVSSRSDQRVIPFHKNVIKNYANFEINYYRYDKDCVGWLTLMELCDSDLRTRIRNEDLTLDERKMIAKGVIEGEKYLEEIGITHHDQKPENILLKNGEPKWIDFGNVEERTGRKSYRQMGYARRGSKFTNHKYLYAGSAGFARNYQLTGSLEGEASPLHIFILCDWPTAWNLLYKPLETEEERNIIQIELKSFGAGWLSIFTPTKEEIDQVTKVLSLEKTPLYSSIDDPNLTKSCSLATLKHRLTRYINNDFNNLTKNVLDQKDSNLCVPISVSILIRWALKKDLKIDSMKINRELTLQNIFTMITMIIYPRSMVGFTLNPQKEEQDYQTYEIERLLKRLKFGTYLNTSGWQIFKDLADTEGFFDFSEVLLHQNFTFIRPLTITCAYLNTDGSIIFHQMVLDRIENNEYILQNNLIDHSGTLIRIPLDRPYYASYTTVDDCFNQNHDAVFYGPNGEIATLVNEYHRTKMVEETWYLFLRAFSITLTKN